jgi:23S rRNA (cytidine1920-2'-O)/16S rRNA (cytidine1409-2'-O)-methyltransferase
VPVRKAVWAGEPERIDRVLYEVDLARSRNHAAQLIAAGSVRVGNRIAKKPSVRVATGTQITLLATASHYVSRSAVKIVTALDTFGIVPEGVLALDLGASTGGFTQVLLERGAREVIALDVGHDQLAPMIRNDARVHPVEGCNARALDRESLARLSNTRELPNLIVGDLSFISLRHILPAVTRVAAEDAHIALLVKPQFEVGKDHVSGGVVRNLHEHVRVLNELASTANALLLAPLGAAVSPITGTHGNREYLLHFKKVSSPEHSLWNQTQWSETIDELVVNTASAEVVPPASEERSIG